MPEEGIRLDKWLWAMRFYKTRSLAAQACDAGRIQVQAQSGKPARLVHVGEVVEVALRDIIRTVRIKALTPNRVGPKLVPDFLEDLTPESEYQRQKEYWESSPAQRLRGAGRPSKKDRREISRFFGE